MHACGYELSETNLNKLQKQIKTYLALHPEFKQIDEITFVYNSKNAKLGFGSDHISLIYQGELRRKPGNLFPGWILKIGAPLLFLN